MRQGPACVFTMYKVRPALPACLISLTWGVKIGNDVLL